MTIRFKCPNCKKQLSVKEHLAGKRAACPACKKPITIPERVAAPADLEALAAAALREQEAAPKQEAAAKPIQFTCDYCTEEVEVANDLAGKQTPCPSCKRIIKVPLPKEDKPKDWRELAKKGPAAALINQPEQLDGAWGTEVKGRVSRTALEEAEAIPDIVQEEPVGLRGWIRRGVLITLAVGVVGVLFVVAARQRTLKQQTNAIAQALEANIESPLLMAEVYRAAGELALREDKLADAQLKFKQARATLGTIKDPGVDADMMLLDLALTEIGLGGDEDAFRAKKRIEWISVPIELERTLGLIKNNEAKVIAVREVAAALIARNQGALALSVASKVNAGVQVGNVKSTPVLPQQVALLFALGDGKPIEIPPMPDLAKAQPVLPQRVAYAEGHAWKGTEHLEEAKKIALAKGPAQHQLEALLAIASVLVADKTKPESIKQAEPFVAEAIDYATKRLKEPNPWHVFQLIRVASRTEHADKAKELINRQPTSFKPRAQYEYVLAQLAKGSVASGPLVQELPEKGPNRTLGWEAVGRYLAQQGDSVSVSEGENADLDRIFFDVGRALGKQDQRQ